MSPPRTSRDPYENPDLFPSEHASFPNLTAGRIYNNALTSGHAQAHYGDRIMYGDNHVHHHLLSHETGRPAPPRRPINTLRWRKDPQFVGREDALLSIRHVLETYGSVALTGAGGVGKSQTAIEFCWRWLEEKPHFHIFWIYTTSIQTFDAGYAELARKLRLPCSSPGSSKDDVRDGVKDWLEENSDWLMVIDNADNYGDFFGNPDKGVYDTIRDALPLPRPGSAMIFYTSRHARLGRDLTEHHDLPITNLPLSDSKALLCKKLGTPVSDESAVALLEALEFLPMSIAHAAAYLKFTKISIQDYLDRVQHDADLLELLSSHHAHVGRRDDKAPRSVVNVISTTLDLLTLHNQHALNLLCFMACLDRQRIPTKLPLLAIGDHATKIREECAIELPKSQTELEGAMGELESLALICCRVQGRSFTMHRLVQATINQRMFVSQTQTLYLLLCAHCLMESYFPGVSIVLRRYDDAYLTKSQQFGTGTEEAQQSLAKYPSGFEFGLHLLCNLGIFSYLQNEINKNDARQLAYLKYFCFLPLEAILAATKADFEFGQYTSSPRLQRLETMADLSALRSFEALERLSLQTIEESTSHTVSMVAARVNLAHAVAGIRLEQKRLSITQRPIAVLIHEAEEEIDGMPLEQGGPGHRSFNHCLLAGTYIKAGYPERAIDLQERACRQLATIFGANDVDVLRHRVDLAEMKSPYSMATGELYDLQDDLKTVYDRVRVSHDLAPGKDREALKILDQLGRVKAMICLRSLIYQADLVNHYNEDIATFIDETENTLKESLLQMERILGMFHLTTLQKAKEVHEFLRAIGPPKRACEFAFAKATSMLEAVSECKHLSDEMAAVVIRSIKLYAQHGNVRLLCERIIFTLMHHLRTQRPRRSFTQTMETMWSAIELLAITRVRSPDLDGVVESVLLTRHFAVCDKCDQDIIGIRHKCLQCPDYDVCSACLEELDDTSGQSCSWRGAASGPHRFAPMYDQYDEDCLHREATRWHLQWNPSETQTVPIAIRANPGRHLVIPIHQRWHKDIADANGYESEPDEGRRTKTQYVQHYGRRVVYWPSGHALRARARSYESLKLAFVLSRP